MPTNREAACSLCQQPSTKVHSRYQRALGDLPCCGKPFRLLILVRRFFCLNKEFARRLFVERVSEVTSPFARKTNRLNLNQATQHWYSTRSDSDRVPFGECVSVGARSLPLPVLYHHVYQCCLVRFRSILHGC